MSTAASIPLFNDLFERSLDSALRVVLPKDWREQGVKEFCLISDSTGSFIKAMPRAEYDKAIAKIESDPNLDEAARQRHYEELGSSCKRVTLDNSNRLALPEKLCAEIGVSAENADVILKGAVRTFNIWNPAKLALKEAADRARAAAGVPVLSAKEFLGV